MSLAHGILGLLSYGPNNGSGLVRVFKDSLAHFWSASPSQIYREAAQLEDAGLVYSNLEDGPSGARGPGRRVYTITDKGLQAFVEWLARPEEQQAVRSALVMRIFFSDHLALETRASMVEAVRTMAQRALDHLEHAQSSAAHYAGALEPGVPKPLGWELSRSYGVHSYRAMLAWADEAIALMRAQGASSSKS